MKSTNIPLYRSFTPVDESTRLGKLFNQVFRALEMARSLSAPDAVTVNGWNNQDQAFLFYDLCLTEMYLHSIIEHLSEWQTISEKYNTEFAGSWKYYAASRRIDGIREFGGEDDDYNDDGSIKTDVGDDDLLEDTVLTELANPHWNSIFLSTTPSDCLKICCMIINVGSFSIVDVCKEMGKPIKTYRMDDNGKLMPNDWTDEAMDKAEKQGLYENIAVFFWSALVVVRQLVDEVEILPKTEDNKDFFLTLPQRIQNIFDLKIPVVIPPVGEGSS